MSLSFSKPNTSHVGVFLRIALTFSVGFVLYKVYKVYRRSRLNAAQREVAAAHGCLPPPRLKTKDPIWGVDFFLASFSALKSHRALETFANHFHEMKANTIQTLLLGSTLYSSTEPENMKTVLSTNFKDWQIGKERSRAVSWFLGDGIFTSDGEAWQHSRHMLRPNFVKSQLGDPQLFDKHASQFLKATPIDGKTMVDLQPMFYKLTLDISTEFLLGRSTGMLDSSDAASEDQRAAKEFVDAFVYCENVLDGSFGILYLWLPAWLHRKQVKKVHGFVENIVRRAKREREEVADKQQPSDQERYVFLYELVTQTSDPIRIRSELLNILLAGRDTTASFLSNIWYELSRRPSVFTRLQSEISTHLPDDTPITFERLKCLKYLQAIMSESNRLYPIVPENIRGAIRDTILPVGGGPDGKSPLFVKKGQFFHLCIYAMQRRKDLYGEDAEEFKPERWLDGEDGTKGLRVGWEYLPFNGGPRICIGQQFALTETAWVTVRLMRAIQGIESRDEIGVWTERLTSTCTGLGGCKVVLTPKGEVL